MPYDPTKRSRYDRQTTTKDLVVSDTQHTARDPRRADIGNVY